MHEHPIKDASMCKGRQTKPNSNPLTNDVRENYSANKRSGMSLFCVPVLVLVCVRARKRLCVGAERM